MGNCYNNAVVKKDYESPGFSSTSGTIDDMTMFTIDSSTVSSNRQSKGIDDSKYLRKSYKAASDLEDFIEEDNTPEQLKGIKIECSSIEDARAASQRSNKPILCFEIEVPKDVAATEEVLFHPLIAEAAESLFICLRQSPVIRSEIKSQYGESRIRVLDEAGVDIVCSINGNQINSANTISLFVDALVASEKDVPAYLSLIRIEENGRSRCLSDGTYQRIDRKVIFGMSDSQIGEIEFADLHGVLATRTGFITSQKVVRVTYDSTVLSYCHLVRFALQRQMADVIYFSSNEERIAGRVEIEKIKGNNRLSHNPGTMQYDINPKHYLSQTLLRYVPLTNLQATKANKLVSQGVFNEATHLLSPRQGLMLMMSIRNSTRAESVELVDVPITRAWERAKIDKATCDYC